MILGTHFKCTNTILNIHVMARDVQDFYQLRTDIWWVSHFDQFHQFEVNIMQCLLQVFTGVVSFCHRSFKMWHFSTVCIPFGYWLSSVSLRLLLCLQSLLWFTISAMTPNKCRYHKKRELPLLPLLYLWKPIFLLWLSPFQHNNTMSV